MQPPAKKSGFAASPSAANEAREDLLKQFRAHLHLAITAQQTGGTKRLAALPGPRMRDYCHALAKLPDNTLAVELAAPVRAILEQIQEVTLQCRRPLVQKTVKDAAAQAELERVLEQLDFALALILRRLPALVRFCAETTKCRDLLCEAILGLAIGDGAAAARWIRRWQKELPEDGRREDGTVESESFPDRFAWDAYQRIAALDELADEFPEHVKTAARQMHAWPMLMHRHTNNRRRFDQLAKRLELGAEYPLDATEGARWRPDTPLVRYLDPLIHLLHSMRREVGEQQFDSVEEEQKWLHQIWWTWPEKPPGEEVLAALRAARQLPALTKATATQWAEKAVVPLILATDARDWENCDEPVLQRIRKQNGVKSRATFKSRLLAAVAATLGRLARPA